jgi:putative phosphonate metabolism protein
MRYAVFFTPPPDNPLTIEASSWLGRDAYTGKEVTRPAVEGLTADEIARLTAEPCRYGFHATLKAPFRLAEGLSEDELCESFRRFAPQIEPVADLTLAVGRLGPFFALVPSGPVQELDRLAGDVVRAFEPFRAPLGDDEIARRNPDRLTERQRRHLAEWGYPYVFEDFRFHMTLTGPVANPADSQIEKILEDRFAQILRTPLAVSALSLFIERWPGAAFTVKASVAIGGAAIRNTD